MSGITGYLGKKIAIELAKDDKNYIIGLTRNSAKANIPDILKANIFLCDLESLMKKECFIHNKIDLIIHTATSYGQNGESLEEIFDTNVEFPEQLLHLGSLLNIKGFINTDTSLNSQISAYAASKSKFLNHGKEIASKKNILFINMKLEYFFGPMTKKSNLIELLICSCIKNEQKIDLTPGWQIRDFIYIDDVVNAYIQVIKSLEIINEKFIQFEIGSSVGIAVRDLANMIKKITNSSIHLNFGAVAYRTHECMYSVANTSLIEKYGWKCNTDIETGITKIVKLYSQDYHALK